MKSNRFFLIISLVFSLVFLACSDNDDVIPPDDIATIVDYDKLADDAVNEFISFAKNPRLGLHLEKARDYLISWAKDKELEYDSDDHGNIWMDLPATKGYESFPNIIIQGHMDMICASLSGESHDYTKTVGDPYREGDLLKGRVVNLGADDGAGVGIILALAASNIPHGPLRLLITANEDYGMIGAANLSADVLNSDYLICVDSEEYGEVTTGCTGSNTITLHKTYEEMNISDMSGKESVTLIVTGLRGGHSGLEIGDHRLSGSVVTRNVLKEVFENDGQLVSIDCGTARNAISNFTKITFVIEKSAETVCLGKVNEAIEAMRQEYPEENFEYSIEKKDFEKGKFCNKNINTEIMSFFETVQHGVIEENGTGRVTKSNNIAVITLKDGKLKIINMFRSDYSEWLTEQGKSMSNLASKLSMEMEQGSFSPAWYGEGNDALTNLVFENYAKVKPGATKTQSKGGLEPAHFTLKRPTLAAVSIGPQIDGAHTIDEALHVSTVKPIVQILVNTLLNADKLK